MAAPQAANMAPVGNPGGINGAEAPTVSSQSRETDEWCRTLPPIVKLGQTGRNTAQTWRQVVLFPPGTPSGNPWPLGKGRRATRCEVSPGQRRQNPQPGFLEKQQTVRLPRPAGGRTLPGSETTLSADLPDRQRLGVFAAAGLVFRLGDPRHLNKAVSK